MVMHRIQTKIWEQVHFSNLPTYSKLTYSPNIAIIISQKDHTKNHNSNHIILESTKGTETHLK